MDAINNVVELGWVRVNKNGQTDVFSLTVDGLIAQATTDSQNSESDTN